MSILVMLAACASEPPSPYYGDERYLVIGVRPDAEAMTLKAQLEKAGFPMLRRVDGQNFTALGFGDAQGDPIKVRVVTARGIELALDPISRDPFHEGLSYALLESPFRDTADADGDGFEEVFVEKRYGSGAPPCVLVYRVRDSGFVDPVQDARYALPRPAESSLDAWRDPTFCAAQKTAGVTDAKQPDAGAPGGARQPDAAVPSGRGAPKP
jgi:hypothetical protein